MMDKHICFASRRFRSRGVAFSNLLFDLIYGEICIARPAEDLYLAAKTSLGGVVL